jgi:hypothetical protein
MSKLYIGIDPGKEGYICIMEGEAITFHPIPLIGKEFDIHNLFELLFKIANTDSNIHCVVEDVHALFNSSAGATFSFGFGLGVIEGILVSLLVPYTKIAPKKWQKELHQGIAVQQKKSSTGKTMVNNTKLMSEMAAKRLFPKVDLRASERCKKSHDGKVDSLLICEFCKRNFK